MGHQESSPPRQHHRVPHHRRHRHHHYHNSAAQTTNRNSYLNLGKLNRESHAPNSHAVVENWLGQLTTPIATARLVSSESRNQSAHRRKHPRSQDSHGSPSRRRPRRADRLWRPEHIPPAQGSSPLRLPLLVNPQRNSKRYERNGGDSSMIGDLSPSRELQEWVSTDATSEHEESSHYGPLDEVKVAVASSPTPYVGMIGPAFEKRPRYKTRADKYDTKKSKDHKRRRDKKDQDKHQPTVSKSKKRKHIVTWRNVMKNFTSDAVTSDRITVQPNLKPGLFNNKRVPKNQPIADLSFSEMPFPTHQERDILQQQELSGSQLRERRRETRELGHISSFFLPTYAEGTSRKPKPEKFKGNEKARSKQPIDGDNDRYSFTTPSSPPILAQSYRQQFPTSLEKSCSTPTTASSDPDCRPSSSRKIYFTWSSSQKSSRPSNYPVDTYPESIEPARSATPENIREALFSTGVYRNTGIHPHEVSDNQQKNTLGELGESSPTRSSITGPGDANERRISAIDRKLETKSKCSDDTGATVAQLARLEERWSTILPPEWRVQRAPELDICPVVKQKEGVGLDVPGSADPLNHQKTAQQARVNPMREIASARHTCHQSDASSNINMYDTATGPASFPQERGQIVDDAASADQDRTSIASRDAMPPPPIPSSRVDSLHTTKPKPELNLSSSIRIETAKPPEARIQVPNCERPEIIDSYKTTGQQCEVGAVPKKINSSFDSVSWIPQAVSSNIVGYDRGKTMSRLSMRSSIYENQNKEINPQGASHPTPSPAVHTSESMADFIMRIESELDEPISPDTIYQPGSIIEDWEFSLDPSSAYGAQNRQLTASDGVRVHSPRPPIGVFDDLECKGAFETCQNSNDYEELAASVMPTEGQGDDFDEFLEMSKFWRPNRFSHH
ncbi:hypothetical protein GGR58DRAFT_505857 [Xylaria digitata]|nr:hypothetical protein GGR58DRAFT_505857 [Xylaria digitata]